MKRIFYALLLCVCCFLMACPLQTDYPIQGDSVKVPEWLPGRWILIKDGSPTTKSYKVSADNAGVGKLKIVLLNESGTVDPGTDIRPAQLTSIAGHLFLSVFEKGDEVDGSSYYHYRLERAKNGELSLVGLKENIVSSGTKGEDLADYLKKHNESEYLDQSDVQVFRRGR